MSTSMSVAVYLIDRAYGGPEEGGWYYDRGRPAQAFASATRTFADARLAEDYAAELSGRLGAHNAQRPPPGSVGSTGEYQALVRPGPPAAWPASRPQYA